jgi:N-acetyl-anhydromuramyl-L-alanine amidase AmpD
LLGNAAWANGIDFARGYDAYKSERSIAWIDKCWRERVNPNLVTVSIEFEGNPGEPLTDAQYAAGLALIKWLCKECDIAPTGEFIVGHYQIDRVNRRSCPGPAFPWARLFSDLNPVEIAHYERLRGPLDELWRRAKVLEQIGTDTIRIGREIEAYIVQTKKQAGFPD